MHVNEYDAPSRLVFKLSSHSKYGGIMPEVGAAESFLKLYSNLPVSERFQTIIVIDNQPFSWEVARNEIIHNTKRGGEILKKLKELRII